MNLKKMTIAAFLLSTSLVRADAIGDLTAVLSGAGYTDIEIHQSGSQFIVDAKLDGVEYHMVYDPSVSSDPISVSQDDSGSDDTSDDQGDDDSEDDSSDDSEDDSDDDSSDDSSDDHEDDHEDDGGDDD